MAETVNVPDGSVGKNDAIIELVVFLLRVPPLRYLVVERPIVRVNPLPRQLGSPGGPRGCRIVAEDLKELP